MPHPLARIIEQLKREPSRTGSIVITLFGDAIVPRGGSVWLGTLLAFFGGLFIVVAGLEHAGILDRVFDAVAPVIARGDLVGDLAFVALIVIGSQLVSNVPLVIIAVHWIPKLPNPVWGFSILAIVSTLAGNLTLFGSMANIIVLEAAGPRGEIGFLRFLRYGALITLVELAIAFAILWLERAIGMPGWLGLR